MGERGDLLRRYNQDDLLASSLRTTLSLAGPVGAVIGEFLTQLVPHQRLDRLHEFVEQLHERLEGLEERFRERLITSPGFAALSEQASLAAVRSPSSQRRRDLAELLRMGLSKEDAELIEYQALLRLLEQLNDAEVLILMRYGSFQQTQDNSALQAFITEHAFVLGIDPPTKDATDDERRRWTMGSYYKDNLITLGLLRDPEGTVKAGPGKRAVITPLGKLLLAALGRPTVP